MPIEINLDLMLVKRKISSRELAIQALEVMRNSDCLLLGDDPSSVVAWVLCDDLSPA
ncbi:hypothetical protein [Halocynthiibacter namhaensis]|uniref:hypothetical protein n=1 Tax=Halocynthiibacter namhaensis TaxID=1290553 RepID=UPI0012DFFEE3|nr:hypothetical protein [Halocynthiibacter namhaensis]